METPELDLAAATPLGTAKTPSAHAMKVEIGKRASGAGGGGDMATPTTEVGVARATRMAMQAKAQVETLLTFGDLDANFVEAAPTNKMILTPLLGGVSSELIEVDESNRAAMTCAFLKKNWLFTEDGRHSLDEGEYDEARFAAAFPEGLRAFSSCRDQKETTQQVAVLVAAAYAMVVFQTLVSLDFGVIVTGGRGKTVTDAAVIVEASQGSGRRKVNVTPADVVRGLSLQSGERCIGVVYDKDEYPGQRIYILNLSDEKFNEAYEQGGYRLLGDKRYFPIPYKPRSGIHKIYMHTGLHAIEAVENDAVPQLAGWLGVPPSQINVSLVGGNLIARDVCVRFLALQVPVAREPASSGA
jgi:hypothetical protein